MFVFSNGHSCIQELIDKAVSWTRNYVKLGIEPTFTHPKGLERHWSRPQDGYVKLNTDGAIFLRGIVLQLVV